MALKKRNSHYQLALNSKLRGAKGIDAGRSSSVIYASLVGTTSPVSDAKTGGAS